MLGGGMDREWLEPLDSEGNRNPELGVEERVTGCHVGDFSALNVAAQPGFVYKWMLSPDRRGGRAVDNMAILRSGGEIVRWGDPEAQHFSDTQSMRPQPIDSAVTFADDVVLVRIPEEKERTRIEEINGVNQKMLRRGPEETFVNRASFDERERYANRGPTRFALRDHQTQFTHDRDTVEVSLPDSGIVRTERITSEEI